jgi:hypothetical protein
MEEKIKRLPFGLKKFVDLSLDLLNLNSFFTNYSKNGGNLNGVSAWIELIRCFINLEIEYDKELVSANYRNIKYVKDLPEEEIEKCLIYISYQLGMTSHTGGLDFYELYKKIKNND